MQTNDATAGRVAALRNLVPVLEGLEKLSAAENSRRRAGLERATSAFEKLEGLIADQGARKIAALERFAEDSPGFARLKELQEEWLAQLDLFFVLGVADSEIHHSRFLAWLLDPQQTHNVDDYFLRSFLYETCTAAEEINLPGITPSNVHTTDWSGTEVRLEWQYIDILVLNRAARFVCAIENKIWAEEGIGEDGTSQLTWYRETIQRHFPDFTKHYVFLSPSGMRSQIPEERKHWTSANYETVLKLVEQTVDCNGTAIGEDVRTFLQQYANTLRRRNIVEDSTELKQLARKIYLDHRDAIELIIEHKPDFIAEAKILFKEAISRQPGWAVRYEQNRHIGFRPDNWAPLDAIPGADDLLRLEFDWRFDGNYPRLGLVASPVTDTNRKVREKLHQACLRHGSRFPGIHRLGDSWLWLVWTDPILGESDYSNWQNEAAIRAKIQAWIEDFVTEQFPAMNEVIVNCLREYEAERQAQ